MVKVQQDLPHKELTHQIIGAAMAVHSALGPGLEERTYENALCLELAAQNLEFSQQDRFSVFYRKKVVGNLITDLIVEGKVIVENKCADAINEVHVAQALGYLNITKLEVALILNFKTGSLTFRRVGTLQKS